MVSDEGDVSAGDEGEGGTRSAGDLELCADEVQGDGIAERWRYGTAEEVGAGY